MLAHYICTHLIYLFFFFFDNRFFSGQQFMGNEHICMEILKRNRKQEHELTQPEVE